MAADVAMSGQWRVADELAAFHGVAPGWYRDAVDPSLARYWDGATLSDERRLVAPSPSSTRTSSPTPHLMALQRDHFVHETLSDFTDLVARRLDLGIHTIEDSIRYTFFAALQTHGIVPERVVMEYPHPSIHYARVDAVVLDATGAPALALEFRYDREGPGGSSQARPQKAGAALADLKRLALLAGVADRYFIYVLHEDLYHYLASPDSALRDVFGLRVGESLKVDADYFASTLHGSLGEWPGRMVIEAVAAQGLPQGHCVRIYAVET